MNALKIIEANTAVIEPLPVNTEKWFTVENLLSKFNRDFARQLKENVRDENLLFEFLYAHDVLHEIIGSSSFPNKRLLNSPDTKYTSNTFIRTLNDYASRTHDFTMFGCAVSPATERVIDEFFAGDYLLSLATVMKALGRRTLMYTLYGNPITLSLQLGSGHPDYGTLEYRYLRTDHWVLLPFKLHRIHQ